ncbi:MAG: tetratricopeptide repeat protein [Bacteroidia bacterium]|jgi:two-component system NarL family sensor kinase|nr:tetratricopeptide repeat protein [Bacteroidia bacterium]
MVYLHPDPCKRKSMAKRTFHSRDLILFFLVVATTGVSATTPADSLVRLFTDKKGKTTIDSLLIRGRELLYTDPQLSFQVALKAVALSKEQNDKPSEANGYRLLGSYYTDISGDYTAALEACHKADKIFRKLENEEGIKGRGAVHHNLATIYHRQSDYVKAIEYYTQALTFFDAIGDRIIRPKTLNNLSNLYSFLKDYPKAEKYATESLELAEKNDDSYMISVAGITLADVLILQGKFEKALLYIESSKKIAEKRQDHYIMELVHLNYGNYYTNIKDYARAVTEYKMAYDYALYLTNEWEQMRILINLSGALIADGKYEEARQVSEDALLLTEKMGSDDMKHTLWVDFSLISAQDGDYRKAYDYLNRAYLLKDTLMDADRLRHADLLESVYQTEKKELVIAALESDRKISRIIYISVILISVMLIVLLFFSQKAIKAKKELVEQEVKQLEKEKQLVAANAIMEGEKAERSRLAQDMHDGLGGMLSAIKLNLFDLKKENGALTENDVTKVTKVMAMLDNSIRELRRVAHNLMPESLLQYGLKTSLQDFCSDLDNVDFHFYGEEKRLDGKLEMMLYRSSFELVNNALKHSEATQINVQVIQQADRISLTVQDNGKGFDPRKTTKGTGLNNISNRVASAKGSMNILSDAEEGTEIIIEFNI